MTNELLDKEQKSFLKKVVPVAAFIAGLCCFSPVVLVLLGLSSVSFASSLADTLYGTYKWAFRSAGLLFMIISIAWYVWKKEKVCTIDELKKKRRKIINLLLIGIILTVLAYVIWLYGFVELLGLILGIWDK